GAGEWGAAGSVWLGVRGPRVGGRRRGRGGGGGGGSGGSGGSGGEPGNRVELLEFRERERAGVRRREQQPAVAARHQEEVRHDLEHGRHFGRQHRAAGGVLFHEDATRTIALGENAREIGRAHV